MAVSRHLEFYRTANKAIRSADPQNHRLEPNMEWIGCTVCEIFAFKLCCDRETGARGHSSHRKRHLIEHIWWYDFIFVFYSKYASISYRLQDITAFWSKIATPGFGRPRWGCSHQITQRPLVAKKTRLKEFWWYIQPFWYKARVWQTDRRTDGIAVAYTRSA